MPAQLVALTEGPSILLDKPILLLGRHPECDIQIESRKISRRHCCIAQVGEYLVVRDLGSTNGIRINGSRVLEGRLGADDELTIGGFRYRVTWDAFAASIGLPPPEAVKARPEPEGARRAGQTAEDVLLEECDEPVPLADEADEDAAPQRNKPEQSCPNPSVLKQGGRDGEVSAAAYPLSFILPEKLELAPSSHVDFPGARPMKK